MREYDRLGASEREISSIQTDRKPHSGIELGEKANSSVTTRTQPQTSKSPLPDAKTEVVYVAQNTNGLTGTLTLKWSPTLVWLIIAEMIRRDFTDPERWFGEYASPRLSAMAAAEEYIEIKMDPNDPAKGVKNWVDQFKFHMKNSLRYFQLQNAKTKAEYMRALETAVVDTELLRQIQNLE